MSPTLLPLAWGYFIFNVLLQVFDGIFTYQVMSLGIPEANPIVRSAIMQWGAAWGLLYWKGIACILLACIFALRHRRGALTINALRITGGVYSCIAVVGLFHLLFGLIR